MPRYLSDMLYFIIYHYKKIVFYAKIKYADSKKKSRILYISEVYICLIKCEEQIAN